MYDRQLGYQWTLAWEPPTQPYRLGQLWAVDETEFTNTYAVNAAGVYYSAVAFLELLDEGNKRENPKQRSQIIATSSMGAFNRSAVIGGYAYESSKAATIHLMKQLTTGLVPYDIRANIIAPGRKSTDAVA
jgi:NAD(P)-dependent dehydrogenase (short-subunit alcohol dehydrogenase family)